MPSKQCCTDLRLSAHVLSCRLKVIFSFVISFFTFFISSSVLKSCNQIQAFCNHTHALSLGKISHGSRLPRITSAMDHVRHGPRLSQDHVCHRITSVTGSRLPRITAVTDHVCHGSRLPRITAATDHVCHGSRLLTCTLMCLSDLCFRSASEISLTFTAFLLV